MIGLRRVFPPVVAMLALVALGLLPACSADEAPVIVPRLAVFPFADPADLPDRLIGRRAADAAYEALRAESPWELADPAWLLRLAEAEGVGAPFAIGHLQMLGQKMHASLALAGLVENCDLNAGRGVAQVTLLVELIETIDGNSLASARGVASATRERGEPLDGALDRALTEAAADAVRQLTSFDAGVAVVVTELPDGRVLMDGPAEPRIRAGSKLLIFRRASGGPEAIGTVEVTTSKLTVLHARPIVGEGFFQGDRGIVVAR